MATEDDLNEGFSLADLADIDVSGIEEVRFVNLPAMIADWEVLEGDLSEDEKDGERRFKAEFKLKIVEVKSVLEPNVDKESLVGKEHTERFFIKPKDPQPDVEKSIGRIRAFVTDIGMDSAGKLGDIVRNTKSHTFTGKIVKRPDKNDKSITYARLVLEQAKK